MSKTVVLAEKPSVARDIARVLGANKGGNGYLEGTKYIVTWALGHLVTLATPDMYDNKYKTWRLEDLPMVPKHLKTIVIQKTGKQFNTVKHQLKRNDVKDIVIATDAGREGELVARWIIDKARVNKPIKRLWISSVTDKAIRDGFKNLQPGKKYENLYASAVARSEADWYVGLNATRALTTKHNAQLSSGRVQTPTLGILATREKEIREFRPQTFYGLEMKTQKGTPFTWQDAKGNTRIFNKEKAEKLRSDVNKKQATIISVEKNHKKQFAPQLYDLTELQRDANRIFNFSGKQTLNAMQNLYERHKVLTYPRTDSRVITTDIVPTLKDRLEACGVDQYANVARKLARKNFKLPKSVVNDAQVSDHHAIIPTEETVDLTELGSNERKIYDLVVKRFLAILSDPHEYEEVRVTAELEGERFVARGTTVQKLGWKEVYESGESADRGESLAQYKEGAHIQNVSVGITEGETKPPERFTEGALLKAMENPAKYMSADEKHLAKTLHQAGGIGTVATRADIIDKLINGQSMELRGKYLYLTQTGKQLLDLAPEELRSPALTAEWEQKLTQIEKGKLNKQQFIAEIKQYTEKIVREIKQADATFKHDNLTGTKCPRCDSLMLEIENRNGKMLRCQDRSCNYKKNVYKNTNARCPNCKKRLKLYGEGDGQTFTCMCGHREKLATFQERRKKSQNTRVSKKDINKYMKKQDDFKNNALAEALAKLKK
ncbi:DNA topoisomerase III [Pseudogracilibacillus sp. SE30717A]|uniref:DNA topoisomerase III n=1 Tax=Pseudogracilibacillus sp. SE30717A TaxID=3098293 RepID=UPI00300DDB2C